MSAVVSVNPTTALSLILKLKIKRVFRRPFFFYTFHVIQLHTICEYYYKKNPGTCVVTIASSDTGREIIFLLPIYPARIIATDLSYCYIIFIIIVVYIDEKVSNPYRYLLSCTRYTNKSVEPIKKI